MNPTRIYTGKVSGLDYRVWLLMLLICLICMAFFGYRQVIVKSVRKDCKSLMITVNGDNSEVPICKVERLSLFQLSSLKNEKVRWDFDDGTVLENVAIAQHQFKQEGVYKVTATLNGQCVYYKNVLVQPLSVTSRTTPVFDIYLDSMKAMAGSPIRFSGVANFPVQTYTWTVMQTNETKAGEIVTFSFPLPGKYDVQLMIDGDGKKTKIKPIEIVALPQAPLPLPSIDGLDGPGPTLPKFPGGPNPQATTGGTEGTQTNPSVTPTVTEPVANKRTDIDEETFKELLQAILNGEEDLTQLNQYLDYDEKTPVMVNGNKEFVRLKTFCQDNKKAKIKTLKFIKNDKNEISTLNLQVKGKGLFGFLKK